MTSSLRNRLAALHSRLGSAGFALACVALILALTGAAFAAGGGLSAKQKKEVKKIAKSFQGTGPIGPQGAKGDPGAPGKDGSNGAPGKDGTDGVDGVDGADGTFSTEPLPSGQTLTGTWIASGGKGDVSWASISFPIQVSPAPMLYWQTPDFSGAIKLPAGRKLSEFEPAEFLLSEAEFEEKCAGSAAEPQAAPGIVCVYLAQQSEAFISVGVIAPWLIGPSKYGTAVPYEIAGANPGFARGTWAVTG